MGYAQDSLQEMLLLTNRGSTVGDFIESSCVPRDIVWAPVLLGQNESSDDLRVLVQFEHHFCKSFFRSWLWICHYVYRGVIVLSAVKKYYKSNLLQQVTLLFNLVNQAREGSSHHVSRNGVLRKFWLPTDSDLYIPSIWTWKNWSFDSFSKSNTTWSNVAEEEEEQIKPDTGGDDDDDDDASLVGFEKNVILLAVVGIWTLKLCLGECSFKYEERRRRWLRLDMHFLSQD